MPTPSHASFGAPRRRSTQAAARLVLVAVLAATLAVGALPGVPMAIAQADTSAADLAVQFPDPMAAPNSASANLPAPTVGSGTAPADPTAGLVEVVEQRTASSKTFLASVPGKFLTQVFSGPVHYQDPSGSGRWLPIDTRLVSVGSGHVGMSTNTFALDLSLNQAADELARISVDADHSLAFGLAEARPGLGIPALDSVTYHGVLPDTDLRLTSRRSGLKEDILLNSAAAPDTFVFPLVLHGLTAAIDPASGDMVYRDGSGTIRGRSPAGYMVDANVDSHSGEGARSDGVTYALVPYGVGVALEVRVDRAWLDAPERVFPVTVDPPWNSTTLQDDTYVMSNFSRDNANDGELKVGTYDGGVHIGISFMHFDVSGLTGKIIDSAVFNVHEVWSWSCSARGLGVYRVTQGWDGHTMTGYPGASVWDRVGWTARTIGHDAGCPADWQTFGQDGANNFILDTVRYWTAVPQVWGMFGLAMKVDPGSETDNFAWKKFDSWDTCGGGPGCIPHIDITYHNPNQPPNPPDSLSPGNGTTLRSMPALSARYTDPDGNPGTLQFRLWGPNGYFQAIDGVSVCNGCSGSWLPPAGPDGAYSWQVYGNDGQSNSGTSSSGFNIDSTGPPAPGVSSSTHTNQSSWYANNTPAFSFPTSDPTGVSNYSYTIDTNPSGDPGYATNGPTPSWVAPARADGTSYFHVRAQDGIGNWGPANSPAFNVNIDTNPPAAPTTVTSDHSAGQVSNSRTVSFSWSAGTDPSPSSGVAGYRYKFNQDATQQADASSLFSASTTPPTYTVPSDGIWYLHVKTVDGAGLLSTDKVYGPIYIDTTLPNITKSVDRTSASRGEVVTYTVTLTNTKAFPVTVTSVSDTLAAGLTAVPASATFDGTTTCTATSTPACVLGPQSFSVSSVSVPANGTRSLAFQAVALGSDPRCSALSNVASATNANGTTVSSPVPLTVCDTGLGLEPWWSYVNEALGPQGQASVNVANGNLVVTQTDSSPVGAHGRFAYVLRRTYNSQDSTALTLPVGLGTPGIGAGWQLNIGQTDDLLGDGVGATALIVPKVSTLDPAAVIYVDRDGTRHVFTPKGLAASAAVDVTSLTSGTLAALRPSVLMSGINAAQYRVCAEQTYQAPPGVHLGLWRYVRVANSGSNPCSATATNGGVVLGFAAERPDRLRYEFAWDGRLLSMVGGAGVELRYLYDGITAGQLVPPAPADLGRLRTVYEPRSCSDPSASSCRAFRFRYSEDTNTACPADATGPVRCVDDPAGRRTKYHLDSANPPHLWSVDNPDGTTLRYTYQGVTPPGGTSPANCGGSAGQLCSASEPRGATAGFAYTAASGAPPGALPQLTKLTDRRGSDLVLDYHGGSYTTADQAGHRRRFTAIDASGRVGEIDEGNTSDVYLHQALYTWDTAGAACRQPDGVVDHNLCRLVRKALNNSATPDEDTAWTYTAEGAKLTQRQATGGSPIDTTWGYHVQYAQAGGTTACLDYLTAGSGTVTVGSVPGQLFWTLSRKIGWVSTA